MKKRLIVGLGNIGEKYYNTRHNVGFRILDYLAKEKQVNFELNKLGSKAEISHKGRETILLKPNTYMNLSGNSIKYWLDKEKINLEHLLIIVDDLHLPFGSLRLRAKGSHAGHNGLKNIEECLNTSHYNRLKFGVLNENFVANKQVDFVLGEWDKIEESHLNERIGKASEIILSFIYAGISNTMNMYNGN